MSLSQKTQMEFFDGGIVTDFLQKVDDEIVCSEPTLYPPGCCATGQWTSIEPAFR